MAAPPVASPVALVTGGTRGIGHAAVRALAAFGARVHFCGRGDASVAAAARDFESLPGPVGGHVCDVRDQGAVEAMVAAVVEDSGRLDVLVNNAGLGRFGPVDELKGEDWREVIDTNLSAAFYALAAAARAMRRQGSGWIFNIASLAGRNPFAGGAAYNASKFGLLGLSEAAMLDLRHHGIRVAAILPGSVDTDFAHSSAKDSRGWMLLPEDVARIVVDFLRFPDRALPSLIELRPSRPPGTKGA